MNHPPAEYDLRMRRHYDELKWLYCELYHNDMDAFRTLCQILQEGAAQRSPDLRQLDQTRERAPQWYYRSDLLGMQLYVKQFAGTLKGLQSKLDYLQSCNANYIHLMQVLKCPAADNDGGYAIEDFRSVDPSLGTMEDLKELTAECHHRGMSVCLDFVMNHTSQEHEWAKRARAGEQEYRDRYFFYDNWDIPNQFEQTVPQVFPTTAPGSFTWLEDCKQVVMTSFYPYQWDLNYGNPVVFNEMVSIMLFLANQGIDIIRIDAVPYIWKQLGTDCRNLPQVHTIVRMLRMITEIVCPGVLLLGEVVMAPEKLAPYFGTVEKPECHMLYNATTMCTTWHTVATQDVRLLRHQLEQVSALPKEYLFLNYLRCHDDIGWGLDFPWLQQFGWQEVPHKKFLNDYFTGRYPSSHARGELYNDDPRLGDARLCGTTASLCGVESAVESQDGKALETALQLDVMLHAYLLTQSGLPILYSGDEIGQLNDTSYHNDPIKQADSRYLHRGAFRWDLAEYRTDLNTAQGKLFQRLGRLEQIRSGFQVFAAEAQMLPFETGSSSVLGIKRIRQGQVLTAVFNFSGSTQKISLEAYGTHTDLYSGEAVQTDGSWALPPYGFLWLLSGDTHKNESSNPRLPD